MGYDRVEIIPAANPYLDARAPVPPEEAAESPLLGGLKVRYAERVKRYENELEAAYAEIRYGGAPPGPPSHDVALPGRTVTIVYDSALDRRLLEVYVLHGWAGIRLVQQALDRAIVARRTGPLHPWPVVTSFFTYTRNMLLVMIRAEMIKIEQRAADRLVTQLSLTARFVNETWATLDVRSTYYNEHGEIERVLSGEPSPSWDTPVYRHRVFYHLGNKQLSARLFVLVRNAVEARAELVELRERSRIMSENIFIDVESINDYVAAHKGELEFFYKDVHDVCPMATLTIPLLDKPVTRKDFEQVFGEVLSRFYGEADRIAAAFTTRASRVQAAIHGPEQDIALERLYDDDFSVEETVVSTAMDTVHIDLGQLSLLNETTLQGLVTDGAITPDSFEFVVWAHYLTEVMTERATRERRAQRVEELFMVLVKVNALLSLSLFASPAGAFVKAVQMLLGVGLITYQVLTVTHQLDLLDVAFSTRIVEFDRQDAAAAIQLTELATIRPRLLQQITQMVITELILIAASGAWPEFKEVLHLRSFYLDLEALISV